MKKMTNVIVVMKNNVKVGYFCGIKKEKFKTFPLFTNDVKKCFHYDSYSRLSSTMNSLIKKFKPVTSSFSFSCKYAEIA